MTKRSGQPVPQKPQPPNKSSLRTSTQGPRDWTKPVIVGVIITILGLLVAVFTALPESQRNVFFHSIGIVPASETPTPTPTLTLTPTSTSTATSTPTITPTPLEGTAFPDSVFGIVLADFRQIGVNAPDVQNSLEQALGDTNTPVRVHHELENCIEAQHVSNIYNATIVLWGNASTSTINVNLLIVPRSGELVPVFVNIRITNQSVASLDNYIYEDTPYILYTIRGQLHFNENDFSQALEDYDRAVQLIPPTSTEVSISYASCGQQSDTPEPSPRLRVEAVKPEVLYLFRGNTYYRLGEYTAAISDFSQAIELDPNFVEAYNNRGLIFYYQGDNQRAIEDLNRAIALDQNYHLAFSNRGSVYIRLGDRAAAAADFMRWLDQTNAVDERPIFDEQSITLDMTDGRIRRIPFTGGQGQVVTFTADSVQADPLLVILGVNGEPLTADDDCGGGSNAAIRNFELPASGTYTLVVGYGGGGFEGSVTVTMQSTASDLTSARLSPPAPTSACPS